jgi:hypothetical protein
MLSPRICRDLFFSFQLEAFGENEESCLNSSQLMDGPILDVEQKVNKWIASCLCLHSRVIGLGYRQPRFEVRKKGDIQLRIANGDRIMGQREPYNQPLP